jgi:hypothetical protein
MATGSSAVIPEKPASTPASPPERENKALSHLLGEPITTIIVPKHDGKIDDDIAANLFNPLEFTGLKERALLTPAMRAMVVPIVGNCRPSDALRTVYPKEEVAAFRHSQVADMARTKGSDIIPDGGHRGLWVVTWHDTLGLVSSYLYFGTPEDTGWAVYKYGKEPIVPGVDQHCVLIPELVKKA